MCFIANTSIIHKQHLSVTLTAIQTPVTLAHSHAKWPAGGGPPPLNTARPHQVKSCPCRPPDWWPGAGYLCWWQRATGPDLGVFHLSTLGLQRQRILAFSLNSNWVHWWVSKRISPKSTPQLVLVSVISHLDITYPPGTSSVFLPWSYGVIADSGRSHCSSWPCSLGGFLFCHTSSAAAQQFASFLYPVS